MAYKTIYGDAVDDAVLDKELLASTQLWKVRISENFLFFSRMLKTAYVPLSQITRAFLRIETTVSRVCCGPAEFHIYRVILCGAQGELAAIEVDSETKATRILAALGEKGIPLGKLYE